jgi:hypothetical protein
VSALAFSAVGCPATPATFASYVRRSKASSNTADIPMSTTHQQVHEVNLQLLLCAERRRELLYRWRKFTESRVELLAMRKRILITQSGVPPLIRFRDSRV